MSRRRGGPGAFVLRRRAPRSARTTGYCRPPVAGDGHRGARDADHARAVQRDAVHRRLRAAELQAAEGLARPGARSRPSSARWSPTRATSTFEHAGSGGMGRMLKKAVDRRGREPHEDDRAPARCSWPTRRRTSTCIYLEDEKITVNGRNLLAFDADIDWDIERVQGAGSMMGGGLFNTVAARDRLGRDPLRRPARAARRRRRRRPSPTPRRRSRGRRA